jgi:ubiquinone/menaquinone biosynthesis C-methylase UbiE
VISSRLINGFRKINVQLNERFFKAEANTYCYYLAWLDQYVLPAGMIIDLGAGSVSLETYLPRAGDNSIRLVAVDSHYNGLANNRTRLKVVANAGALPFRDETVDVVTASCFFEHMADPAAIISECHRVLKKRGALVFYTPHRRSYVAAIARITPLSFHRLVRTLQTGQSSDEVEVCETFYKMNTHSDIVRYVERFRIVSLQTYIGAPCYTTFLPPPVHLAFVMFSKILQRVNYLRRNFGESIIGCLVKP